MFTVCSKCNLRLTVTATDLRAAQGYVRCGRCHNVFNALAALADDPTRQAEHAAHNDTQTRLVLRPPEPPPPPEPEPVRVDDEQAATDTSLEFNPASTNINEVFIEAVPDARTGTFETIILASEEPASIEGPSDPVIAPQALSGPVTPAEPEHSISVDVRRMRDALAEPLDVRPEVLEPAAAPDLMPAAQMSAEAPAAEATPPPDAVAPASSDPSPAVEIFFEAADSPPAVAAAEVAEPQVPAGAPASEAEQTAQAIEEAAVAAAPDSAAASSVAVPEPATPRTESVPPIDEPALDAAAETGAPVDAAAAHEIASAMLTRLPAPALEPDSEPLPAILLEPERVPRRLPAWAAPAGAAALGLFLVAQLVHHYRGDLAQTSLLRRPLAGIYQALGQPIEPHWEMANYEIRQLGATSDAASAGNLVVRASISNRAPRDQPLPLLRVVMQDRFGNRVAARDLRPVEYLGRGAPLVSLIAPGQRVDVQVAVRDPGQAATGFEIDACMMVHQHTITCANDPGTR